MVTLITFAFWENEGSVGVTGLEDAGVTDLDTGGESSNNCAISDDLSGLSEEELEPLLVSTSGLEIVEWELILLTFLLRTCSNGSSNEWW